MRCCSRAGVTPYTSHRWKDANLAGIIALLKGPGLVSRSKSWIIFCVFILSYKKQTKQWIQWKRTRLASINIAHIIYVFKEGIRNEISGGTREFLLSRVTPSRGTIFSFYHWLWLMIYTACCHMTKRPYLLAMRPL